MKREGAMSESWIDDIESDGGDASRMHFATWAREKIGAGMVLRAEGDTTAGEHCISYFTDLRRASLIGEYASATSHGSHTWPLEVDYVVTRTWRWRALTRAEYEEETQPPAPVLDPATTGGNPASARGKDGAE